MATSSSDRGEASLPDPLIAAGLFSGARERPFELLGSARWGRDAMRRRLLALADLVAATVGAAVLLGAENGLVAVFAYAPIWLLIAKFIGLYDRDHRALRHTTVDELPTIFACAAWSSTVIALLGGIGDGEVPGLVSVALSAGVGSVLAGGGRALTRAIWWRMSDPETTLVIGEGEPAAAIRRKVELLSGMHLRLGAELAPQELGEGEGRLAAITRLTEGIDRIVLAAPVADPALIADLLSACRAAQVKLSVVSPLRGTAMPSHKLTQVADLPILEYNVWDVSRSSTLIKRGFDILIGLPVLILTLPLLGVIAVAILLTQGRPILFSQIRAGRGGEPFCLYKFRTMEVGAEAKLDDLLDRDQAEALSFKLSNDPRVTPLGRRLRRFSLDELPQLFNVIRGEMSIVGPRPEQIELVRRYGAEHRFRLLLKPGMTGPMQVYGRGDLSFEERLAVELDYVENLSLARDLRILLLTLPVAIRGDGAY